MSADNSVTHWIGELQCAAIARRPSISGRLILTCPCAACRPQASRPAVAGSRSGRCRTERVHSAFRGIEAGALSVPRRSRRSLAAAHGDHGPQGVAHGRSEGRQQRRRQPDDSHPGRRARRRGRGHRADFVLREPTPEFAAEVAEQCQRLLDDLPDEDLRRIAVWKMEGHSNEEIAAELQFATRTIERKSARWFAAFGRRPIPKPRVFKRFSTAPLAHELSKLRSATLRESPLAD